MYVVNQDKLWRRDKWEMVEKQRITKYMDSMVYISGFGLAYYIVQ